METKEKPVIQVKNLYKLYRVGDSYVKALNGVNLEIYKGEFCSIVGTSGSGKSTLLNMLAGLEKPTRGEIIIAGEHMENKTENQLVRFRREHIGFIFQSFNLLGTMNAGENVARPLPFQVLDKQNLMKRASRTLDRVGQTGHLQVLVPAGGGLGVTALEFGNGHVLFRFQLGRIQRRMEGHVLDHVHARLPVPGGHVGDVPGLVETGGRVEVTAQGFHIPGHLPLGTLLRSLEDHMLQHMADARLLGGLVGGTRSYEQSRSHQR